MSQQISQSALCPSGQRIQVLRRLAPNRSGLQGQHDAELGEQSAQAVNGGRAFLDETLAHAVHGQHRLLLDGLDRNEAHLRPARCFANGRGIMSIVLPALTAHSIRRDELGGHDARPVTQRSYTPRQVMRSGARLHSHHARRHRREDVEQLLAPDHTSHLHLARLIDAVQGENVLG